jgi:hypothetical protein
VKNHFQRKHITQLFSKLKKETLTLVCKVEQDSSMNSHLLSVKAIVQEVPVTTERKLNDTFHSRIISERNCIQTQHLSLYSNNKHTKLIKIRVHIIIHKIIIIIIIIFMH